MVQAYYGVSDYIRSSVVARHKAAELGEMKYGWLIYALAGGTVAAVLHFAAHFPWFFAALAALVGWPLIGTLVTADDDLPGGWSNPDGTQTPEWRTAPFWGRIILGLAISGAVGAFDEGIVTSTGIAFGAAALVCAGIGAVLLRPARRA